LKASNSLKSPRKRSSKADNVAMTQTDKFIEAARELECDDDEARFDERVKKLVKQKPVEKPE
jgi:hypothetical protein